MPNGLIAEDSLRAHPEGLALSLTLPWYRSLWLSSVATLTVTIDGVGGAGRRPRLRAERRALPARPSCPSRARRSGSCRSTRCSIVRRDAPIALGETAHRRDLTGSFACPTCRSRPGQDGGPGMYVPNFVRQALELTVDRSGVPRARDSCRTVTPPSAEGRGRSVPARPHALLGQRRIPGRPLRPARPARPVAAPGIGPGIEIVASQMLPQLPGGDRGVRARVARRLRPAWLRPELVRREPRHGAASGPRHDPGRGVRLHRDAVPQRARRSASRWCASRAPNRS